jgi:transcriptional regulator with XRE-family HTH domain
MPTKALKKNLKKKSHHVVAWVREALGLKQSELASLIGISRNTLQSIELGRLPLSERIAYRLSEQTGIRAKWLLDNELGDLPPDPAEMRRKYEHAQAQPWPDSYPEYLLPRMFLFRLYVFGREIAAELGGENACRRSGFNDALVKMNRVLLDCLPDNRSRRKVYFKAKALLKGGAAGPIKVVIDDAIEMRRVVQKLKADLKARQKWLTAQVGGEASSAFLSQKGPSSAPAPAEDGQGQSSASPLPRDSVRQSS